MSGCTLSLGGKKTPGPLVVARIPSVIVPVCVVRSVSGASVLKRVRSVSVMACVSEMACVSACGELKRGRFQTRDGIGEPFAPYRVIVEIAPVSRDVANEACSAFSERSSRARLRGGIPVREHPAFRERPSHGRLKWRRGLGEFGTRRFPRGRVFGASRAAYRVLCSRSARSGFLGSYAHASCRLGARVTSSSAGISRHECRTNSARPRAEFPASDRYSELAE